MKMTRTTLMAIALIAFAGIPVLAATFPHNAIISFVPMSEGRTYDYLSNYGYRQTAIRMGYTDCHADSGVGMITATIPSGTIDSWALYDGYAKQAFDNTTNRYYLADYYTGAPLMNTTSKSSWATCKIMSATSTSATLVCDRGCPQNYGLSGLTATTLVGYYANFTAPCSIGDKHYPVSDPANRFSGVVCNQYRLTCEADGSWLRRQDGYSTSAPACPATYSAMCKTSGYAGPMGWIYSQWFVPGSVVDEKTCANDGTWV